MIWNNNKSKLYVNQIHRWHQIIVIANKAEATDKLQIVLDNLKQWKSECAGCMCYMASDPCQETIVLQVVAGWTLG